MVAGDDAVANSNDTMGIFGDVGFVGDQHDSVALGMKFVEECHDLITGFGVQISSRFVREDDGRVVYKSAGDGDALALAAGELVGLVKHARAEIDALEHRLGALGTLSRGGCRYR